MPYLSLYRKYRPQCFADVVGQDHVVQTLQNALRSGRIANGYLFCGTRGVAKTTLARILAKGLNCIGVDGNQAAPQAEPCGVCIPCRAIASGQSVDVVEMDAASNRSVNDIAKLRESVQFGPMENRFKTYIVDEAHQLSSDAKDAFLKTLEEPPPNVVFILATTEAHSIPITIASRCQRFDFKRGSIAQISHQLVRILGKEGVSMRPDAITFVARSAEGSYRDSLSLLDQVLAYKRQGVTVEDVAEVLGAVDTDVLARTVDLIAASDAAGVFILAEEVFNLGKDVRQFLKGLAARFRDMLFVSSGAIAGKDDEIFVLEPIVRRQAGQFSQDTLLEAVRTLTSAERETKTSNQHRLLLELTLLSLMHLPSVVVSVVPPAPAPSSHAEDVPAKLTAEEARDVLANVETSTATIVLEPESAPLVMQPPTEIIPLAFGEQDEEEGSDPPDLLTLSMFSAESEPPVVKVSAAAIIPPAAPMPEPPAQAPPVPDSLRYLQNNWVEVVNHMRVMSQASVPVIKGSHPVRQEGQLITLEVDHKAFLDKLEKPAAKVKLEEAINKTLREPPETFRIRTVLKSTGGMPAEGGQMNLPAQPAPDDMPSDLLDEVIAVFGGRIIEEDT